MWLLLWKISTYPVIAKRYLSFKFLFLELKKKVYDIYNKFISQCDIKLKVLV